MIATMRSTGELLLVLMKEDDYVKNVRSVLEKMRNRDKNVCYVCLSRPYSDVADDLKVKEIDIDKMFFVDVLTSHYKEPDPVSNCNFLKSDEDLVGLMQAVDDAINKHSCGIVVFDAISSLLSRREPLSIMQFANSIAKGERMMNADKLFLFYEGEEPVYEGNVRKDLEMFADKKLDLT